MLPFLRRVFAPRHPRTGCLLFCFSPQEAWEQFSQEARERSKVASDLQAEGLVCGLLSFFLFKLWVASLKDLKFKLSLYFHSLICVYSIFPHLIAGILQP